MHTRVEAFKICCITTSPVRIDLTKGSPTKLDIKMPKKDSLPLYILSRKEKNYNNKCEKPYKCLPF